MESCRWWRGRGTNRSRRMRFDWRAWDVSLQGSLSYVGNGSPGCHMGRDKRAYLALKYKKHKVLPQGGPNSLAPE
jgi:hypothetical protein